MTTRDVVPLLDWAPGRESGDRATHYWLPWDYNRRQAYPIIDGDVHVFVRFSILSSETHRAGIRAFVNGRPVQLDGGVFEEQGGILWAPVSNGYGELSFSIPNAETGIGLNQVSLQTVYDLSRHAAVERDLWRPTLADNIWTFTVVRERDDVRPELEDTAGYELGVYEPNASSRIWRVDDEDGGEVPIGPAITEFRSIPDGLIHASLRAQEPVDWGEACGSELDVPRSSTVFLALLDGEPVPLGSHTRIVATLEPGEQRIFRFSIDLPNDGEEHMYEILALGGQGLPSLLRSDEAVPPWGRRGRLLLRYRWGGE